MKYCMFLDDERFPPKDNNVWVICRSFVEAKKTVAVLGWPIFISFDHDLGEDQYTGKDFANWMIEHDLQFQCIPSQFEFYVHSQNPVGAENIRLLLEPYLAQRRPTRGYVVFEID